ncbi:hypothetical protein LIA77_04748 [Sarocladium implicatum]|nr:hypothetical protein LIA77_04748 [Sarocladium implicatum]
MSQRGPPSLPTSRPQSQSSVVKTTTSGERQHGITEPGVAGGRPPPKLSGGAPDPNSRAPVGARGRSSIDNMLNPPEVQSATEDRRPVPTLGSGPAQSVVSTEAAYRQPHYSPGSEQLGRGYPPPGPDGSRKILSPRGPRAASASFAVSGSIAPAASPQPAGGHDVFGNRPFESVTGSHHRPQLPPMSNAASLPGTPSLAMPRPARTNSQPMLAPTPAVAPSRPLPLTDHQRSWPVPGQASQISTMYETTGGPPHSVLSGQELQQEMARVHSLRAFQVVDPSTSALTWSRLRLDKAKSAEASGRHRSKRKAQTSDMQKEIQALKDAREQDKARLDNIIQQRDFYREERNRLRDLVSRTPQIARWAAGPQSPTLVEEERVDPLGQTTSQEDHSAEPPRQLQRHISYGGSERQNERLAPQGESTVQPDAYRPPVAHTPMSVQTDGMPYPPPGHPPPPVSRSVSATQLPPIGTMGVPGDTRPREWEHPGSYERGRESGFGA